MSLHNYCSCLNLFIELTESISLSVVSALKGTCSMKPNKTVFKRSVLIDSIVEQLYLDGQLVLGPGLVLGGGGGDQALELAAGVGGEGGLGPAGVPVQGEGVGVRTLPQEGDQLLVRQRGQVRAVAAEQLVSGLDAAVRDGGLLHQRLDRVLQHKRWTPHGNTCSGI